MIEKRYFQYKKSPEDFQLLIEFLISKLKVTLFSDNELTRKVKDLDDNIILDLYNCKSEEVISKTHELWGYSKEYFRVWKDLELKRLENKQGNLFDILDDGKYVKDDQFLGYSS